MANFKVIAAETNVATDKPAGTFLGELVDSLTFPLMGEANEVQTKDGALKAQLMNLVVGAGIGGYVTRKRVAAGQGPMLGFFL